MPDTPISRRDLLRAAGGALGAAALTLPFGAACASRPAAGAAQPSGAAPSPGAGPLVSVNVAPNGAPNAATTAARVPGIQLYTVRSLMQNDVEGTLAALAGMGYKEVEFAGYFGRDPKALRRTLDGLGLRAPTAHVPLEVLRTSFGPALDAAAVMGHRYVVCPYLAEVDRTADNYRRLAADLNRWGEAARARGMRMGYHNHDFEFAALPNNERGLDLLLAGTDPALVAFEMDLYWVTYAGQDPLALFARSPGRFELWHMKDLSRAGGQRHMADVGGGDIDFRRIYAQAAQAGVRHLFVERDDAPDPIANIRASYAGLRRVLA